MLSIIFWVLVIAGALSPVYLFPSGQPQPTDYVFVILVCLVYIHSIATAREIPLASIPLFWIFLTCWVAVHCLVSSLVLQSSDFYRVMAFWIYNTAVASCFLYIAECGDDCNLHIERAICMGLVVSGIGVIVSLGEGGRTTGFFNNPNQLAFFSLLGVSSLLVINRMCLPLRPLTVAAVFCGIAGIFAAASLAAIAGFFLVAFGYLLANLKLIRVFRFLAMAVLLFMSTMLLDNQVLTGVFENVHSRSLVAEGKFNSIGEERNYDRIIAFPEYAILGAGEGHLERFYPYDKNEIHSSFGNLLFAYGIPGMALFVVLLLSILRKSPLPVWFVVSGPIVYSLTHMGLRTTLFWIFLALVWSQYGRRKPCQIEPWAPDKAF